MLIYLFKTIVLLSVSIILYKLFLENTTINRFKRFYLLVTLILAFVLPSISFSFSEISTNVHQTYVELSEIVVSKEVNSQSTSFDYSNLLYVVYGIGVLFLLYRAIKTLVMMHRLKKQGTKIERDNYQVVVSSSIQSPFSFWQTMYVPLTQSISETDSIYIHELTHIKQRHSIDILLVELLTTMFWFNPLLYIYKNSIALNHEFLADAKCTKDPNQVGEYMQLLLEHTYQEHNYVLSSSFNFNLTQKRFIMITKKNNPIKNVFAIAIASIVFTVVGSMSMHAQVVQIDNKATKSTKADPVLVAVDEKAEYPGGMNAFMQDFLAKFRTPAEFTENNVRVIVTFVVAKDGSIVDAQIIRDPGFGIGKQVVEILQTMKKWEPAVKDGVAVASQFTLPITIQTQTKEKV